MTSARRFLPWLVLSLLASLLLSQPSSAQILNQGQETTVTYSGSTAYILPNGTPANNVSVTSGVTTYIMGFSPVNNSVRVFITNETANACNSMYVEVGTTGSAQVTSVNNNLAAWQQIQVQQGTGGFNNYAGPFNLPANGNVQVTSQPLLGNKVVIQIILNPGNTCPTTTINAQAVFGPFSPSGGNVQGVAAQGANAASVNPVLISGLDHNNNNTPFYILDYPTGGQFPGVSIGGVTTSVGTLGNNAHYPNGDSVPLGVLDFAQFGGGGAEAPLQIENVNALSNCNNGSFMCKGLYVADNGFIFIQTFGGTTSGSQALFNVSGANAHEIQTCRIDLITAAIATTGQTFDVWLQDSPVGGSTWTDRVHFHQVVGPAGGSEWLTLSGMGTPSTTLTNYSNQTIAAGTVVQGAFANYWRIAFSIASGSSNVSSTIYMNCK